MAKYFPFVYVSLNQVKSNQVYGDFIGRYKQSNTEKTVVKNLFFTDGYLKTEINTILVKLLDEQSKEIKII